MPEQLVFCFHFVLVDQFVENPQNNLPLDFQIHSSTCTRLENVPYDLMETHPKQLHALLLRFLPV